MYRDVFIKEFSCLGREILSYVDNAIGCIGSNEELLSNAILNSFKNNDLFTPYMQRNALKTIALDFLAESQLSEWTYLYSDKIGESNSWVLVVMAGNLPLVGFHDLLAIMASGKKAIVKLSSKDKYLLPALMQILSKINVYWKGRVTFTETIEINPNILIATGGDQTAALFKSKFGNIPNLIRGAKMSVAILKGDESNQELELLGGDLFLYFGMGCRSVSTLLLPDGYDLGRLVPMFTLFSQITADSHTFNWAYRYQKALCLMKKEWFYDGGFFIFMKNAGFPPPISVIGIVYYSSLIEIDNFLNINEKLVQCVVNYKWNGSFIKPGQAQNPSIDNYADGVNSLEFLVKNN